MYGLNIYVCMVSIKLSSNGISLSDI